MAHILNMEEVAISLGSRPILADLNLSLEDGSRIGVVGVNGGGKSTLLKLLMRTLDPDSGRVTAVKGTRFAFLDQQDVLDAKQSVRSAIHADSSDYEWASDAHIREIHRGLIPEVDLDTPVGELSGGQRRRVALAQVLCSPAEIMVLDEPTNHLDVEGVTFLAKYLNQRFSRGVGALVVVTHDRWFLDAVCQKMWEVVPANDGAGGVNPQAGYVEVYEGGYAAYILQRAERERQNQLAAQKRNNLLRKELAWLRRGAPARTSKPRFRIEAANELIAKEPPPRDSVSLAKMATARLGKDVIDLLNVTFAWGEEKEPVLRDVTLRLAPGERLGILGRNGAGKSSLLGLLNGDLRENRGKIKRGKTVVLATLRQNTEELDEVAHRRVIEAVSDISLRVTVGKKELTASQLVENLGFTRERAWTKVADLSGGERRRLQLLRLLMGEPNVLLLDEPTNDLDTDSLAAIEDVLDSWPGTLIVVSHDRYLLERITDRQVAIIAGNLRDLPRGVDEYLELSAQQNVVDEQLQKTDTKQSNAASQRILQKSLERVERKIKRLNVEKEKLGQRQTDLAISGDYEQLATLGREISVLETQLETLETEWLSVVDELEKITM